MAKSPPPPPSTSNRNKRKAPPTDHEPSSSKKSKTQLKSSKTQQQHPHTHNPNHRHQHQHPASRVRQVRQARTLPTQPPPTNPLLQPGGTLNTTSFVAAREFEILALERGIQISGQQNHKRAFQLVPRELRRRTGGHDVKRVPGRLRERVGRERIEDGTGGNGVGKAGEKGKGKGGGGEKAGKAARRSRLREEGVKALRALGAKRAAARKAKEQDQGQADKQAMEGMTTTTAASTSPDIIQPRKARIKKASSPQLAHQPPSTIQAKFRNRQRNKSWLPTHLYHAKRAHLTPPSDLLWRFALPLTPTQKGFRATHRAAFGRGCVGWDVSYFSTVALNGREDAVEGLLRGLGMAVPASGTRDGVRWRRGFKAWEGWAFEREGGRAVAPVTVLWACEGFDPAVSATNDANAGGHASNGSHAGIAGHAGISAAKKLPHRHLFLRVHPSAFPQLWEEVSRLAKVAKPAVKIEDLRFEIGSLEICGPGSTEALLGVLHPWLPTPTPISTSAVAAAAAGGGASSSVNQGREREEAGEQIAANSESDGRKSGGMGMGMAQTFLNLAGLTNPGLLPAGAVLGFDVQDPRLRYPPRTIALPTSTSKSASSGPGEMAEAELRLARLVAEWPPYQALVPTSSAGVVSGVATGLFDRKSRLQGGKLPSQKSLDRRKALAPPGEDSEGRTTDPRIPVLLYTSSSTSSSSSTCSPLASASSTQHHLSTSHKVGTAKWTLLAPWRSIPALWKVLMQYPLSTGSRARFGGLDEYRQVVFEAGQASFPMDFPGTEAGWAWEVRERDNRERAWRVRPKSKRVVWEKVDVGIGGRGELGVGWGCDWGFLVGLVDCEVRKEGGSEGANVEGGRDSAPGISAEAAGSKTSSTSNAGCEDAASEARIADEHSSANAKIKLDTTPENAKETKPNNLTHLTGDQFHARLNQHQYRQEASLLPDPIIGPQPRAPGLGAKIGQVHELVTVHLTLLTRGLPKVCARVYRLPSSSSPEKGVELRKKWLAQLPGQKKVHHIGTQDGRARQQPRLSAAVRSEGSIANYGDDDEDAQAPEFRKSRADARRSLAASLLSESSPNAAASSKAQDGRQHPSCPGKEDLIGFVTTANYDLGLGKGGAVGSLLVSRVLGSLVERGLGSGNGKVEGQERLCVIRNAGESVGLLARWDVV